MNELVLFFHQFGLPITIIAVVGIAILGVMKYCKLFAKYEEKVRHYIYILISFGISLIGTIVYLAIVGMFEVNYVFTVAAAIWALNQTFYNIFKVTPINELCVKLLDFIKGLFIKKSEKQ